ncbi:hypothetical protein H8356DRAFT_1433092 [Neocallimastix lanati (nom. inval.)]|nr:hypothetical protein H8356DRAFT_1433092 [Neocallimastix sp. JGI-2020a]
MNNIFTRRKYYSYHNRVKQNMLNQYKGDLLDIDIKNRVTIYPNTIPNIKLKNSFNIATYFFPETISTIVILRKWISIINLIIKNNTQNYITDKIDRSIVYSKSTSSIDIKKMMISQNESS